MSKAPHSGWIGCDLDGTLAVGSHSYDPFNIGAPIPAMVRRIQNINQDGYEVRIFTARVCSMELEREAVRKLIEDWTELHIGMRLKVTNEKDYQMSEFYDDRAITDERNTGKLLIGF